MPKALNEFEKRDRILAMREQRAQQAEASVQQQEVLQSSEQRVQSSATTVETPAPVRKRRGTFNGTEGKLTVHGSIPGYHLHVFTDNESRIQNALDNGYEFVRPSEIEGVSENVVSRNGDLGDRIRFLVNPRAEGSQQYGYLMKIRQEWYEEDQAALQTKNNMIDQAIRKGKVTGENSSFYVPNGGITMKQT
jgi:hypothetical protein